jgi:CRISPR/Cas system-associated exonuclease Cas4 (RecB family)
MSRLNEMKWRQLPEDGKDIVQGFKDSFIESSSTTFTTKTTFSPSKIVWGSGGCPRLWYFLFNGVDATRTDSSFAKDNMSNGTDSHERMQKRLMEGPLNCEVERELKKESPPIRAFCDVVVKTKHDGDIPIEIKTAKDEAFAFRLVNFEAAAYHRLQLLFYMDIMDAPYGFIMYENKNTYDKLLIPVIMNKENRDLLDKTHEWMRTVYKAYEEDKMPMFFKNRRVNSKICQTCEVREHCDAAGEGVVMLPLLIKAQEA